jgi:ABC-type phosphate transport system permease subunit
METTQNWLEFLITRLIKISGYSAIIFVGMIFLFLIFEGLPTLQNLSVVNLLSSRWYPIEEYFGILPLLGGSLVVTIGAAIFAIPIGILTAIFISEVAPRWAREFLKPMVEMLGGLPSVVLGFYPNHCFSSRGCPGFSPTFIPGCCLSSGCNSLADNMASYITRCQVRGANCDYVRDWASHWGNNDGDDGNRKCPSIAF